ncbi:MAG: hypothetical protein JRJ56_07595, partial [Deltaproteobacteria bacterium]|nr:hypothetical protein [Deltaproteobacteria bacterium]
MKFWRGFFLALLFLALAATSYATSFYDDFSGTSLDTGKWEVLSGGNYISVDDELSMCGYNHMRIVSRDDFLYGFLEGDFTFRDKYHKFG